MSNEQVARVGIGIFVIRNSELLLGRRRGSHGEGEFGGPGGHLEYGETCEETLMRELLEECGEDLKVTNIRLLCVTDILKYHPKHYLDIGFCCDWVSGEPRVMEPDKVESWDWYSLDNLPSPLFGAEDNYIEAYRTGRNYFPYS